MIEQTVPDTDPNNVENNPIEQPAKRKYNRIKKAKNPKENKANERHKPKIDEMVKWTIHVQEETKVAVGKAITRSGMSVTDWVDSRLRQAAVDELTTRPSPPAKIEDVKDFLQSFANKMQTDQEATRQAQEAARQAQDAVIQQQAQQLAAITQTIENNRPLTFKEMLFGRSKSE